MQAPDGGSFVLVEVELQDDYPIPLTSVRSGYTQETEMVLHADGRDYPLTGPGGLVLDPNRPFRQGGNVWVAVEGEPTDMEVRVTVDGVTQVVDTSDGSVDAGQAAGLADLPTPDELRQVPDISCGKPERLDSTGIEVTYRPHLDCLAQFTLRTPYVDGLGWAEPGREFFVLHMVRPSRLSLASGSGQDVTYWDSRVRFTARLGGAEPVSPLANVNDLNEGTFTLQDPENPDQLVFDVAQGEPVGDLVFDLVVDATRGAPFVKEHRKLVFEWTIAGAELG